MSNLNVVAIINMKNQDLPSFFRLSAVLSDGYTVALRTIPTYRYHTYGLSIEPSEGNEERRFVLETNGDEYTITEDNRIVKYYNLSEGEYLTPPTLEVVRDRISDSIFHSPLTEDETRMLDSGAMIVSLLGGYIKSGYNPEDILSRLTIYEYGRIPEEINRLYELELNRIKRGDLGIDELTRQLKVIQDTPELQAKGLEMSDSNKRILSSNGSIALNAGRVFDPVLPHDRVKRLLAQLVLDGDVNHPVKTYLTR